ncbi:MAG: Lrp/AsnC family transcriptional regulator [Nitrososphaerota archaeon]|nr:Lrp/AsnC family transcriptional regulator [Nitrososphaerota archaeon]MDG6928385.1 Lrp/AsnC family transcriptional regulator [Nitrososphaerota archaeon]MDG6929809.1 Lrp/AsnC family transcriptional regulator [Nitrososphaerota archaeon]MDG6932075.1 Lrp/AsnC family transcriptional regulator [Nitrososphaerota archaeon]MDG6936893.1 Lrp/AsnC family transcriptional regulator [Nitrososphaerota archaeon]
MEELDEVDSKILRCLTGDCRLSYRKIANYLNLSTSTVSKRINRMIDSGIILSFVPLLNSNLLNINMYVIGAKVKPGYDVDELAKSIGNEDYVTNIFLTVGSYDMIIMMEARDNKDMLEKMKRITGINGIGSFESFQIIDIKKQSPVNIPQ